MSIDSEKKDLYNDNIGVVCTMQTKEGMLMRRNRSKKNIICIMTVVMLVSMMCGKAFGEGSTVTGNVSVDGDSSDWKGVAGSAVDVSVTGVSRVESWKVAYSPDGSTVFICYEGTTPGCYYSDFLDRNLLITQNGVTTSIRTGNLQYYGSDFSLKYVNSAPDWGTPGAYVVEISISADYFTDNNFTLALQGFANTSAPISASEIPVLDGNEATDVPDDSEEGSDGEDTGDNEGAGGNEGTGDNEDTGNGSAYEGIVIDGSFSDWDGVEKHDAACRNPEHTGCLDSVAAVFDGDYVYLYIKDGVGGFAYGAGDHSKGMFAITTDLGRNMVFQLNSDGTVSGIEGVESSYVGNQWEIAIPKDALPQYLESISFGLYQGDVFVSDMVNLQDDDSVGDFEGIVYDGLYADWDTYPHTLIQYATAGTNELIADGEGALYTDGTTLYGHVVSPMIAHISHGGGELTRNIAIRFNEDDNAYFFPRLVTVDENGNINWQPKISDFEPGNYEFYLAASDAWGTSKNISNLHPMDTLYGKMTVTVRGDSLADETEFYLDLELIAQKLGVDASEFKTIQAKFGQIGYDWITTAGASSGAIAGIVISLSAVGAVLLGRKVRTSGRKKSGEV